MDPTTHYICTVYICRSLLILVFQPILFHITAGDSAVEGHYVLCCVLRKSLS